MVIVVVLTYFLHEPPEPPRSSPANVPATPSYKDTPPSTAVPLENDEKIPGETADRRHVVPDVLWEEAVREAYVLMNYGGPSFFDRTDTKFDLDMADAIYTKIDQFGDPEEWKVNSRETRLRDLKIRILDYIRQEYHRVIETTEVASKMSARTALFGSGSRNAAVRKRVVQQLKKLVHNEAEALLEDPRFSPRGDPAGAGNGRETRPTR